MYFEKFPITFFSLDDLETVQLVRNIFLRLNINQNIKDNLAIFDEYDILDGETPEIVADKFYRNPQLHWLILHMNDILDPRFDWPLSHINLIRYSQSKYANVGAIHHYIDANGYIVNSNYAGATSVSNFDYEDELNENKRRIKVLKPQYVEAVNKEFNNKLENING